MKGEVERGANGRKRYRVPSCGFLSVPKIPSSRGEIKRPAGKAGYSVGPGKRQRKRIV